MGACHSKSDTPFEGSHSRTHTMKPMNPPRFFFSHHTSKKNSSQSPSSDTVHTAPITPSSAIISPTQGGQYSEVSPLGSPPECGASKDAGGSSSSTASANTRPAEDSNSKDQDQHSIKKVHQAIPNSIVPPSVCTDHTSVSSQTVASFQNLKLQAHIAEKAAKQRKRKLKVADRYEQVQGYRMLWNDFKEIQERVLENSRKQGETGPVSFLKQPQTWFVDFNAIHQHQYQKHNDSPEQANLSLLSEEYMQAQLKFFEEKKQRTKTSVAPKTETATSLHSANSKIEIVRGQTESKGYGPMVRSMNVPFYQQRETGADSPSAGMCIVATSTPIVELISEDTGIVRWRQFEQNTSETDASARRLDFAGGDSHIEPHKTVVFSTKTPTVGHSSNPFWEMSTEQFLMMSSPAFRRPSIMQQEECDAPEETRKEEMAVATIDPLRDMSPEHFLMLSTPAAALDDSVDSIEHEERVSQTTSQGAEVEQKEASPSSPPLSPAKSVASSAETIGSSTKLSNKADSRNPIALTDEDEDDDDVSTERGYSWDGHMDDEDFWDMERRRSSLDECDELASQVSSQISSLLSKFREDNSSLHTRTFNP
eukprot:scaffold23539_cov137-Cylindrotheca_fusiformis.AAC.3